MAEELSYLLITPYSILKSRTGGIIARLLSRTDLDLIGAQIFAPTAEFTKLYADGLLSSISKKDPRSAALLHDYVIANFSPSNGRRHRVFMLLFKGENAAKKLYSAVGALHQGTKVSDQRISVESIRDTYADLLLDEKGDIKYFEPAVLTPPDNEFAVERLRLFGSFLSSEPNLVENMKYEDAENIERTLAIIKPDNWRYPSSKPGNVIDMFSRSGLRIIGCKIYQMSVGEAIEFYGPVKNVLREKLAPKIAEKAKRVLEEEFKMEIPFDCMTELTKVAGEPFADDQFYQIIEFMTGKRPTACPLEDYDKPGLVKSMVLVYEGKNAVKKIRDVLGPTDPTKAPFGTVRREFGHDIMVNTAHASDSAENATREMGIIKMAKNNTAQLILDYLKRIGKA